MSAIKTSAKAIKEGYETFLKGYKNLTVSHKSTNEGGVTVTISGPAGAIDSAHSAITTDTHQTLVSVQPDKTIIHSAHMEVHEGAKGEKEGDVNKVLTINHVITTY